ncbi:MAG: hypothetical protein EZS28_007601 [Streblomastix strix]|uniref:Uncharacterized protein n=1 Tax=Streblomastix strix TaxID=222440 RepID=A0A5J4WPF2_9EUKA|nr:MAG: hypothetical protein EZS28_007601 [Streblomastix strix]
MEWPFSEMSRNSIKPEPSEPGQFVNFETPEFTAKTPVTTAIEQPEIRDNIRKFLQSELQPTLQDIERQLTSRQAVSERTQTLIAKVLKAMTCAQASGIDFWATKILDEQNGEAEIREIQCPSLLLITSVPVTNEVLDSKRSPIDKILQNEQGLALYSFRICEGILAHLCELQEDNFSIDVLSLMIYNLMEAERTHYSRARNENEIYANYFNLATNSINSLLNNETESRILGAQVIARSDTENNDAIGNMNLLFGIEQLGKARTKTKKISPLNTICTLETNNETQVELARERSLRIKPRRPRGQPPQGLRPTVPYVPRSAAIPQTTIFPPALYAEQEIPKIPNVMKKETIKDHIHKWIFNGFELLPVDKDDEKQYWPGFCPGVPYATDQRKSKRSILAPSMDEVRALWKECNFNLRVECVRKEYDSEYDQETLQPTTLQDRNLQIDLEDIEIDPYHHVTRDQDMTLQTEAVNRENDKDQGVIQNRETIKVQKKQEWMSIEIRMYLRLEANREAEADERIEEGILTAKKENRAIWRENNYIKRDIEKRKSTTHIQNRALTKQRIHQTGIGLTNMIIRMEDKTWMTIQMMSGQIVHQYKKIRLKIIAIKIHSKQKMKSLQSKQQLHNPNRLSNKYNEYFRYKNNQNNRPQSKYQDKQVEKTHHKVKTTLMNEKQYKRSQPQYKERKSNMVYLTQRMIGNSETAKQQTQQQITSSNALQNIASPAPKMISTRMNKDKPNSQTQRHQTSIQTATHRVGVRQRYMKLERELQQFQASQQHYQQENYDLNNMNVDIPDIRRTAEQLIGLQPSSGAQSPSLSAGLMLKETGSTSASNMERIDHQINEGHDDNADEEEDEQTDEVALIKNKHYEVIIIIKSPVQENLGTQPQNNKGLNPLSQMGKDNAGPELVRVQEKPKRGKRNKQN